MTWLPISKDRGYCDETITSPCWLVIEAVLRQQAIKTQLTNASFKQKQTSTIWAWEWKQWRMMRWFLSNKTASSWDTLILQMYVFQVVNRRFPGDVTNLSAITKSVERCIEVLNTSIYIYFTMPNHRINTSRTTHSFRYSPHRWTQSGEPITNAFRCCWYYHLLWRDPYLYVRYILKQMQF